MSVIEKLDSVLALVSEAAPVIVAHGFNYGDRVRLVPEADSGGEG